jgi:Urocanase Rossmann-like domain
MLKGSYDVQANTLRIFAILGDLRADWGGSLIVSCGIASNGADMALAANIAGAACLSLDGSAEACRGAMRLGEVDFAVNSLDEALRVLKNEIRKGQPISVALELDPLATLDELLGRGVLPQLFTVSQRDLRPTDVTRYAIAAEQWHAQGTLVLDFGRLQHLAFAINADDRFKAIAAAHCWTLANFGFDSAATLRSFDVRVLELIPAGDPRRRWVAAAPRHFHRNRFSSGRQYRRALLLTEEERELLMQQVSSARPEM